MRPSATASSESSARSSATIRDRRARSTRRQREVHRARQSQIASRPTSCSGLRRAARRLRRMIDRSSSQALPRLQTVRLAVLPPACRFHPTCSEYAASAVEQHGALRGGCWRSPAWRDAIPGAPAASIPYPPRATPARRGAAEPRALHGKTFVAALALSIVILVGWSLVARKLFRLPHRPAGDQAPRRARRRDRPDAAPAPTAPARRRRRSPGGRRCGREGESRSGSRPSR